MTTYTDFVTNHLKNRGLRVTKTRILIADLLENIDKPVSAHEVKNLLSAQGKKVDAVTIYRILECFDENQLIHRVLSTGKVVKCNLEGEAHCHLHQKDRCHYLLICDQCGVIDEMDCPEATGLMKHISHIKDFLITGHNLEFTGICKSCA